MATFGPEGYLRISYCHGIESDIKKFGRYLVKANKPFPFLVKEIESTKKLLRDFGEFCRLTRDTDADFGLKILVFLNRFYSIVRRANDRYRERERVPADIKSGRLA